ncbi:MAG: hypothetical protein IJJ63_03120 [Bacilli bacterium]|nr:hypothetical protein [Bacilli bacterium]
MDEEEIEELDRVLDHVRSIRDKTIELISGINTMDEKIKENCLINDENPKKKEIEKILEDLDDNVSEYRNYVIPRLKDKTES